MQPSSGPTAPPPRRRVRRGGVLGIWLLLALPACVQTDDPAGVPAAGPPVGADPAGTDAGNDAIGGSGAEPSLRLQGLLRDALEEHGWWDAHPDSPGCAAAISDRGHRTVASWGSADVDTDRPIEADTVFDVASVSKMFTAATVAALVTDDTIAFDDPVNDWFPELGHLDRSLTVADLVHHTSGLDDYIGLLADEGHELDEPTTMDMALDVVAEIDEVAFTPGTAFDYSNTNYVLLAALVERATGEQFSQVMATRLLDPLDLAATTIPTRRPASMPGLARGHEDHDGWHRAESRWTQVGDGAVHTSVGDLVAWAEVLMDPTAANDAGLDHGWHHLMVTPGPVGDDGAGYGGGLVLHADRIGHDGSWLGYSAALWWWPLDHLAVAVACNVEDLDATAIADELIDRW